MSVFTLDTVQRSAYALKQWRSDDFAVPSSVYKFPLRPDATIVSATIPLFYIGRNSNGVWVVREADGRSGGLFLLKQSALRFARRQSEPAGCAMMFLAEPFELDIENQGTRYADPVSAIENAARHAACRYSCSDRRRGMAKAFRPCFAGLGE
jgi:hypothetical protein